MAKLSTIMGELSTPIAIVNTETLKLLKQTTEPPRPSAVVMTFCLVQGCEVPDTEQAIRQLGAPLAPVRAGLRVAYSRAHQTGLAAMEFESDGKAADELKRLYEFVCMNLYASAPEDV
ncbi:hypothetical protein [Pseudoroseomonas ludipueritiae]|uniref:Uncharacterized protein n=1 Tax=Pseudoroseomonas ludipueritiae TaxID=198093 RepID=A0ABR7R9U3_9PROT|nr:hypothetical protein [Pseudoroseomonas ludipueritiae]MBC9178535.1 hypothetical protein [Pseudoroseomonas ludipueritiae]